MKEEAKPDVKPKATMESTRLFKGKIFHWLKVEVKPEVKDDMKPEVKDEPFVRLAQALEDQMNH